MTSALELRFTDPAAPLFIDIEGDESDGLFVISTSQFQGTSSNSNVNTRSSSTPHPQPAGGQKRPHPDNEAQVASNASGSGRGKSETPRVEKVKRSMKAVQRTEVPAAAGVSRQNSTVTKDEHLMPPPSFIPNPNRTQGSHSLDFSASQDGDFGAMDVLVPGGAGDDTGTIDGNTKDDNAKEVNSSNSSHEREPLFYPQLLQIDPPPVPLTRDRPAQAQRSGTPLFLLSQLSQKNEQAIRESGLGIECMNREELEAMLEGDGEEFEFDIAKDMEPGSGFSSEREDGGESLELFEDEFGPTQDGDKDGRKVSWCRLCFVFCVFRYGSSGIPTIV